MLKKIKVIGIILSITLLTLGMWGCGSKEASSEAAPPAASETKASEAKTEEKASETTEEEIPTEEEIVSAESETEAASEADGGFTGTWVPDKGDYRIEIYDDFTWKEYNYLGDESGSGTYEISGDTANLTDSDGMNYRSFSLVDGGLFDSVYQESFSPASPTAFSGDTSYKEQYLAVIKELYEGKMADQFYLVGVDGGDIPELIASDSEGSFEHENAFIYTFYNGKAVLLASGITGVDGTAIGYSEGNNIIFTSSGLMGETDIYSEIKDGELVEVFRSEELRAPEPDENGDEVFTYSVNGTECSEAEYYSQNADFVIPLNPFTNITYDGVNVATFNYENGVVTAETTKENPYSSYEEMSSYLSK